MKIRFIEKLLVCTLALLITSSCGKKEEIKEVSASTVNANVKEEPKKEVDVTKLPDTPQMPKIPEVLNITRSDTTTDIESFKLLGFTLGDSYAGKLGHDWTDPKGDTSRSYLQESQLLRIHRFNGAIFTRLMAPPGLGEIALLLAPETKKILDIYAVTTILDQDLTQISDFLNKITQGCSGPNINDIVLKIKNDEEFSYEQLNQHSRGQCEIEARGRIYERKYIADIYVGTGDSVTFRNGNYRRKFYKPSTLALKLRDGLLSIGFVTSEMELGHYYENAKSPFYAKTGLDIEDTLKKEIANLVSLNDPNAILAAAKTTNNPNEALLLLSKIEEKNIEAKVLAGQINLKSLRSSGQIKLEKSPQDAADDAFSRLKFASDLGNLQAKELLADMYAYGYGIEKNLTVAAKLFLEAGGVNSAKFFNFCMNYKQVAECNSVVDKQNEFENKRKANELATMNRVTIVASCAGVGKDFIQTVMMAMASDVSSGISVVLTLYSSTAGMFKLPIVSP